MLKNLYYWIVLLKSDWHYMAIYINMGQNPYYNQNEPFGSNPVFILFSGRGFGFVNVGLSKCKALEKVVILY